MAAFLMPGRRRASRPPVRCVRGAPAANAAIGTPAAAGGRKIGSGQPGRADAEIAARLFVGEAAIRINTSNLLARLVPRDRVQAVVFADESGLVRLGAVDADGAPPA